MLSGKLDNVGGQTLLVVTTTRDLALRCQRHTSSRTTSVGVDQVVDAADALIAALKVRAYGVLSARAEARSSRDIADRLFSIGFRY